MSAPVHYALVLFPGFQLLDVAGPIDVLNLISSVPGANAENITLTIIASTLEPVSTNPVPPETATWSFDQEATKGYNLAFNQQLVPNTTFDAYLTPKNSTSLKPVDVLIIPGGIGTRINRVHHNGSTTSNVADLQAFITAMRMRIQHSIITICTGSDVLASTDFLNGRRATTNMTRWNYVTAKHPSVKWLKARRWVKSPATEMWMGEAIKPFNGPIYTSAGISAGIDVMLAFVTEHHGGVEIAREVARRLEYEWREIGEGEVDSLYDGWEN